MPNEPHKQSHEPPGEEVELDLLTRAHSYHRICMGWPDGIYLCVEPLLAVSKSSDSGCQKSYPIYDTTKPIPKKVESTLKRNQTHTLD